VRQFVADNQKEGRKVAREGKSWKKEEYPDIW